MSLHFQTAPWVARYMAGMIPRGASSVLEPTPGEGNIVRELSSYRVTAPREFWEVSGRFDSVVMNPPFTPMSTGYKILFACMGLSDSIIALMPWLTIINSEGRTSRIIEFGLRSVTHLPRSAFPGSRVQTCILELEKGYSGEKAIRFLDKP